MNLQRIKLHAAGRAIEVTDYNQIDRIHNTLDKLYDEDIIDFDSGDAILNCYNHLALLVFGNEQYINDEEVYNVMITDQDKVVFTCDDLELGDSVQYVVIE